MLARNSIERTNRSFANKCDLPVVFGFFSGIVSKRWSREQKALMARIVQLFLVMASCSIRHQSKGLERRLQDSSDLKNGAVPIMRI